MLSKKSFKTFQFRFAGWIFGQIWPEIVSNQKIMKDLRNFRVCDISKFGERCFDEVVLTTY